MLLGILFLYFHHQHLTGVYTFSLTALYETAPKIYSDPLTGRPSRRCCFSLSSLPSRSRCQCSPSIPGCPTHHVEAPTAGIGHPGGRFAEDGDVRLHPFFAAVFPWRNVESRHVPPPDSPRLDDYAFDYRDHLRRAGFADAEGHEENWWRTPRSAISASARWAFLH